MGAQLVHAQQLPLHVHSTATSSLSARVSFIMLPGFGRQHVAANTSHLDTWLAGKGWQKVVCPARQARRVLDIVAQDCMFDALKAAADAKGMTFVNKPLPGPVAPGPLPDVCP